jgi:hypothetical protein
MNNQDLLLPLVKAIEKQNSFPQYHVETVVLLSMAEK